jgi:hypothetical protein
MARTSILSKLCLVLAKCLTTADCKLSSLVSVMSPKTSGNVTTSLINVPLATESQDLANSRLLSQGLKGHNP